MIITCGRHIRCRRLLCREVLVLSYIFTTMSLPWQFKELSLQVLLGFNSTTVFSCSASPGGSDDKQTRKSGKIAWYCASAEIYWLMTTPLDHDYPLPNQIIITSRQAKNDRSARPRVLYEIAQPSIVFNDTKGCTQSLAFMNAKTKSWWTNSPMKTIV